MCPIAGSMTLHAVMCGACHNLRMILAKLRLLCARFGVTMQLLCVALLASSRFDHVATA
jgi:IS5 family transposase